MKTNGNRQSKAHTREARTSQEASLIGVTRTTYRGALGGQGMLHGAYPRPRACPAPSPETHTHRFRQDSAPERGSEEAGAANRKEPSTDQKHCLVRLGKSCPSARPKSPAPGGGAVRIQIPALAFQLCKVLGDCAHFRPHTAPVSRNLISV